MSQATALLADAETSIKAGEWDQALEQLENLKKDQPGQPEVYEKLAHVLAVRGKFQSVITTYLELIRVLVEAESLEHADRTVSAVLALRPESGEARERRIEIENKRGNVARAVYLSRELARLCIDQGDGERSIRLLQDALKHEPGNLDIALELAEMFVSHGHIQDGANQYRKVANAFQEAGNIAKAAEAYRRMKVVQSDDPEVLLTLGRLYTQLGKLDEAEQEFRSVLRHDLDHEQALLQLGLVCQLKGRFRSGILAFNKVLQNNPNLVAAKQKLGELHHSQGMMTEAIDFFLQAAQGHLEADVKEEAIECFQIVLSVDENNAPAQQGLTNLGAPVQPRAFEPPTPPTPPEEESVAPEAPPPPPVPFASATPPAVPEPVSGGVASERTERLAPMDFDSPSPPDPPKPEPKRPQSSGAGSSSTAGATGGQPRAPRQGLTGGLSMKAGLGSPGGDKPMLGGDKPTLGSRPGLGPRAGLGHKMMGGGPGGDKPMLGGGGLDRRPSLGASRVEAAPQQAAPLQTSRPSFVDSAPLEDFSADMALDDVFAAPPALDVGSASASLDDDFALPDSLFDDPASTAETVAVSAADLFGSEDDFAAPPQAASGPAIGDFRFDSDDDGGGNSAAPSSLRPTYAPEPPEFGEEMSDDLFDFDASPDGPSKPSAGPTLAAGGLFDGESNSGDDLFGDQSGGDLFGDGPGDDLFGDHGQGSLQTGDGGGMLGSSAAVSAGSMFDDQPVVGGDSGMFDGDRDPFANIFDEPTDVEPASETIGGSLGGVKPATEDFRFDDDAAAVDAPLNELSFGGLFDEPEEAAKTIPLSNDDDLFGGDDLFGDPAGEVSPAQYAGSSQPPTVMAEPDEGLFSGDSASNDLFGDDDLFSTPEPQGGSSPAPQSGLFDADESAGSDLFSGPDEGGFDDGGLNAPLPGSLGLDAPLDLDAGQDFSNDGLFDDDSSSGGLFEASATDDDGGLFNGVSAGGDLFGGDDSSDDGLFGGPSTDDEVDDFASNGAAGTDGGGLFGADYAAPVALSEDAGLFEGLDSGNDTLFDGFGADEAAPETVPVEVSSSEGLFNDNANDDLFGDPDDGLFGDPGPTTAVASPSVSDFEEDGGDLFGGDFSLAEEARDDIHLPLTLTTEASQSLFEQEDDDGSLFDLPLHAPTPQAVATEALDFGEPSAISIPGPVAGDNLFGDDSADDGGLFGSVEFDETPPPLDLDLPMPGDAPIFSESAEEPPTARPVQSEASPSFVLDEPEAGSHLFEDAGDSDAPFDFNIPEPTDAPQFAHPEPESEPVALFEPESDALSLRSPEPEPEPEETPEFMALLDLTMPKAEEEASIEPEVQPIAMPEPSMASAESVEIPINFGLEEDVFESSLELMPSVETETAVIFEDVVMVSEEPVDLMSAEERMEIAQTAQADALEESLSGADVASKIAAYRKVLEDNADNLILRTRLADIHLKYGLLEDAVVQYRQVMRRNPDSIPLLHRVIQAEFWNENYVEAGDSLLALAHLHLKRGEHHEALDTLQSVLSLDPLHFEARKELVSVFTSLNESKLAAHHLRQLAETALTKGEVSGAISAFQQLLEISDDPTFEERLAQIYESQGDVAKALSSFQSLVGRYRAEERWEEAARVTERIVELEPNMLSDREALIELYQRLGHALQAVEQQFQLARAYQERSELERAIALYEEVLKFQVNNFEARRFLVDAYLDNGRVTSALEQAESLTEHYLDTKDHATAIYLYSRLVDADPENVELQERLVKFYGLAGDPENAKSRWIHISHLHERNERFDRAAEAVQKALELDENQIELQHRLALLYAEKLADNQAALTQLRKLFQMAPERTDAVKMYIDLLLKEEQVSEAGQVLQRLEQAGGESVEIKSNVIASLRASVENNPGDLKARFNYGELCYHLGDLDHAIEQFQQTRRHPDYELMSYNMLGLCFASKRGYMMLDLAIKQFKKGLDTKGRPEQDYLELRYNLAMVHYQNGRAGEALSELKECYNVDIAYRDVRSWIQKIESEQASSGS